MENRHPLDLKDRKFFLEGELKRFNVISSYLGEELSNAKIELTKLTNELDAVHKQALQTNANLHKAPKKSSIPRPKNTIVSDHALLRFFERILGYNLEEVRGWILTPDLKKSVENHGDGTYAGSKYKIVVKNNTVVTILDSTQRIKHYKNLRPGNSFRAHGKISQDDTQDQIEEYYREQESNEVQKLTDELTNEVMEGGIL